MTYSKETIRNGRTLTRFASWADLGAYYADKEGNAFYTGCAGGWSACGSRDEVTSKIAAGQLRGSLDNPNPVGWQSVEV